MNVLSLFDGMSCGHIALDRAGIPVDNYYASEIDKHAISVSEHNYPNIIRLGDVRELDVDSLPHIDILIGGSPCTNFSFAGKRSGMTTKCKVEILDLEHYLKLKDDGFKFEGQSYLFWEYMRIKNALQKRNPDLIFLLENVMMTKKWEAILTGAIGVEPIMINSALVSAQNRKRLYWTNIEGIEQPEDKKILLRDILEPSGIEGYDHTQKGIDYMGRTVNDGRNHWERGHHHDSDEEKSTTLVANLHKGLPYNIIIDRRPLYVPEATKKGYTLIQPGDCFDITFKNSKTRRGRNMKDKCNCLTSGEFGFNVYQPRPCTLREFNPESECHHAADADDINGHDCLKRVYAESGKSPTVNACTGGNREPKVLCKPTKPMSELLSDADIAELALRECDPENGVTGITVYAPKSAVIVGRKLGEDGKRDDNNPDLKLTQCLETAKDGDKSRCLTSVTKDALVTNLPDGRYPDAYNTLEDEIHYRKLTPLECERLQTVPDGYTSTVSNSQRYKMLGNGWTVDVIAHMFMNIPWFLYSSHD